MNIKKLKNNLLRHMRIFTVLLAGIFLVPALRAQPGEPAVQGRFLLIFDTSSAMKSRVEAVQKALNAMLVTSLKGQLHSGDTIGVWTFGQDLQMGNFPLQTWNADNAVMIASNLTKFVGKQNYAKTARFEALQPLLNQKLCKGSERLTVLIFCDGTVKAAGTPFDAGINQMFQAEAGRTKQGAPAVHCLAALAAGQIHQLHHGLSAGAAEHPGLPAVAGTAAARAEGDKCAAAGGGQRRPVALYHAAPRSARIRCRRKRRCRRPTCPLPPPAV